RSLPHRLEEASLSDRGRGVIQHLMLRLKLTLTDMRRSWYFPVCSLIPLLLLFLAYYFQLQRLQRKFGDVSDWPYRLAPSDWLSFHSINPLILNFSMSW